jgi:DNA polymerase III epsilon subunit-like protein
MKNNKYIALDLELTENREIIQIGAIRYPEKDTYNRYILPLIYPEGRIELLTGITEEMLKKQGTPLEQAWTSLTKFGFFNRPVYSYGNDAKLLHPSINGIDFSAVYAVMFKRYGLGLTDICDILCLKYDPTRLHNAVYDANLLMRVIEEVSSEVRRLYNAKI